MEDVEEERTQPIWTAVQIGSVAVVKPANDVQCLAIAPLVPGLPRPGPITLLMRRSGSGAEVAGDRGIDDGALGGRVNAAGTARSATAKVAMGDRWRSPGAGPGIVASRPPRNPAA